jgi:hypothetical protein
MRGVAGRDEQRVCRNRVFRLTSPPMQRHVLLHLLKRPIAILSLIALLVAQAAAGSHAIRHLRLGGEGTDVPGVHTQICLECASFAPLASPHGGGPTVLTVAAIGVEEFIRPSEHASVIRRSHSPFRSRAPPC